MMQKLTKILTIAAFVTAGTAHAGTPQWKLSESSGTVNILRSGVSKIAISGGPLNAGDVIVTGTKSRAVLVRGQEYVVVSPSSRLRISAPRESSGVVQFFEELGNVLFRIDKKATPHFGVQTPYLAAVVKGTTFSVTVTESGTAVQVTEGAVQVATLDGGATQLLSPGMIGVVNREQQFRLSITGAESRIIDSPNAPDGSSETPEPMNEETLVEIARNSFEGTISAPVLETPVSLSQVTGGLVSNAATPAPMSSLALNGSVTANVVGGLGNFNNSNPGAVGNGSGNPSNGGDSETGGGNGGANGNGNNGNGNGNGGSDGGKDNGGGNGNGNNGNGNGNGGSDGGKDNGGGNGNGNNGNGNGNGGSDGGKDNGGGNGNGNNGNGNGGSGGGKDNGGGNGNGNNGNGKGNGGSDGGKDNGGGNGNGNNGNGNGNGGSDGGKDNGGGNGNGNNGNGNGGSDGGKDNGGGNGNGNNGNGNGNGNGGKGNGNGGGKHEK